jgi:aspartyl-tRNA(Asn)/glutamyl-tRNA(Gln) amidotransferase subunit A
MFATKGIRTTWGCRLFEKQVLDYDATVVQRLRQAGAVLLGKLSMNELATGPPAAALNGPVRNPWNLNHWVHGSSTGPAACVAAGFSVFAIGAETTTSILGPASACGVTGLRPTYGRVSRHGAMPFSWTMDKVGPMARGVADCAEVFTAIHGVDANDPTSVSAPFRFRAKPPRAAQRLGLVRAEFDQLRDYRLEEPYNQAIETLRGLGFSIHEIEVPKFPYGEISSFLWQVESWSVFEPYAKSGELQEALIFKRRLLDWKAAALLTSTDYLKAQRIRHAITQEARRLCQGYDALLAPINAQGARPLEPILAGSPPGHPSVDSKLLRLSILAGLPGVTVPCGFTGRGLPVGLTFLGNPMADDRVLEVAQAYQVATDWHLEQPVFRN